MSSRRKFRDMAAVSACRQAWWSSRGALKVTARIAVSAIDPIDNGQKQFIRNADLLSWLHGQYGDSGISILERFHGQGFDRPCFPGEVSTITVYSDTPFLRASVTLPQRYERSVS